MKLVATFGAPPPRAVKAARAGARGAGRHGPVPVAAVKPSPAAEIHAGRELLEAARTLLSDLVRCARAA
jgi:hypothetical protein